jgi:hypothetical protein
MSWIKGKKFKNLKKIFTKKRQKNVQSGLDEKIEEKIATFT